MMLKSLQSRFGGTWDGGDTEIHGLLELGDQKLKIELLFIKATLKWQCCLFKAGEVVSIESGDDPMLLVNRAVAAAM